MAECGEAPLEILRQLSKQSSEGEGTVNQEVELLQCVYLEELQLTRYDSGAVDLLFHVTPSTGEDVAKQYIYLDLHLLLSPHYPEQPADISISASRGLSDTRLKEIVTSLGEKAATLTSAPMVYELVELTKELLTSNNIPCGECVVCLHPFRNGEAVTRTDCYHYFHTPCLARYLKFYEKEQQEFDHAHATGSTHFAAPPIMASQLDQPKSLECPVCRDPIAAGSACLEAVSTATPTQPLEEEFEKVHISPTVRRWQQRMSTLLRRQEKKGGLIDINAKDQVIDETWVRPTTVVQSSTTPSTKPPQDLTRSPHKCTQPPAHGGYKGAHVKPGARHDMDRQKQQGRGRGNRRKNKNKISDQTKLK